MTPGDDNRDPTPAAASESFPDTIAGSAAAAFEERPRVATAGLPCRFGNYLLLEKIGEGGMGVVYKARQDSPDRLVALKMIRAGQLGSADEVRRFRQEADQAGSLDHPHIVPVYDCGEVNGQHYFSMKLVEGGGLNRCLDRFRADPRAAARLLATVARAVHHAHQRQLLHRDLKPANILLDTRGEPNVADFGLAKRLGTKGETVSGAVVGTPEYMPPEQAEGKKGLTTAADVYALGAVLYELLTGRPPFRGETLLDTLRQVTACEPAPPRTLNAQVPRDLETVCLKCLHKDPGQRYGSAEALAEELERWLNGQPVRARPVGWLERAARWARRNPAVAGLLIAFVLALVAGTMVSTYFALEAGRRARDAQSQEQKTSAALVEVSKTRDRLQAILARSLLRPLGHRGYEVTAPEMASLRELSTSSDQVRFLFVQQALEDPVTARQLRNRADLAIHAAVGLDLARRQRVEEMLLAQLRDPMRELRLREDCVFIGLALDEHSQEFAGRATLCALEVLCPEKATAKWADPRDLSLLRTKLMAERTTEAVRHALVLGKATDPSSLSPHVGAVVALAPRLTPQVAAEAARKTLAAMSKTNDPSTLFNLAFVVAALAPRLETGEVAEAVRSAVGVMARASTPCVLESLAEAVAALAPRLRPTEAARRADELARILRAAMHRATTPSDRVSLVWAVAALAPRLSPGNTAAAVRQALAAMGQTNSETVRASLVEALRALVPWQGSAEAARVGQQLVLAMGETTSLPALFSLARVVTALAPRLSPVAAAEAARHLLAIMGKVTDPLLFTPLADAVAALAARLRPRQAAEAARSLLAALGKTRDRSARSPLVRAVGAPAPLLSPKEADETMRQIVAAAGKTNDSSILFNLAWALAALAPRLEPAGAADATRYLVAAMDKTRDPSALSASVRALVALAPRLSPVEATQQAGAAARQVLAAMSKTNDSFALSSLAGVLAALAPRLKATEAAKAAGYLIARMDQTNVPDALQNLALATAALAAQLGKKEAAQRVDEATQRLLVLMGKIATTDPHAPLVPSGLQRARIKGADPFAVSSLARTVAALAPRLETKEATRRVDEAAKHLRAAMGKATDAGVLKNLAEGFTALAMAGLGDMTGASRRLPPRFSEQQLVDLLKLPTCQQPARAVLVQQLSRQCGRPFADMWKFVAGCASTGPTST